MTAGPVLLAVVPAGLPVWTLALMLLPVGLGGPLAMPTTTTLLVNGVPAQHTGTASGIFNTSRQLDGALAVAVFGALIADQGHFIPGLRTSLIIAALATLTAATAALYLRTTPTPASDTDATDEQPPAAHAPVKESTP